MPTVSVFARLPRTSFLPCTKETMRAIRSGQLSLRHGGRSGPARLYERLLLWSFGPIRILSAHENTSRAETGLCHLVSIPCAGPQARPHTDGCATEQNDPDAGPDGAAVERVVNQAGSGIAVGPHRGRKVFSLQTRFHGVFAPNSPYRAGSPRLAGGEAASAPSRREKRI